VPDNVAHLAGDEAAGRAERKGAESRAVGLRRAGRTD